MSNNQNPEQQAAPEQETPVEHTNAYRAGYMAGYTNDNPNSDPSVAGYMDGYFVQQEGTKREE